jgi:hypothetical protein
MKAGIVILCLFSAVWAGWSLSALHAPPLVYVAIGLLSLTPVLLVGIRRSPQSSVERGRRTWRLVGLASAFEAAMIFFGAPMLARAGRSDLIVCLVSGVVGLHFLPLARWMPAPKYYVTGLALLVVAGFGVAVPTALRILLVGGGAATILWLTAWSIVLSLPRMEPRRI